MVCHFSASIDGNNNHEARKKLLGSERNDMDQDEALMGTKDSLEMSREQGKELLYDEEWGCSRGSNLVVNTIRK